MLTHFYDIESLRNVFTLCEFKPEVPCVEIYYLCDDRALCDVPGFRKAVTDRILEKNKNFHGDVELFDLSTEAANKRLAAAYGLSNARLVNDPASRSDYPSEFRPVCDTDPDYDENVHPYLMGYNSYNYDTTMLAMYLYEAFYRDPETRRVKFTPVSASLMRDCSDTLFLERFKSSMPTALTQVWDENLKAWGQSDYTDDRWKIRKCMMMSGRHIDVARLNEKQQHVGLKRLVGMMGGQILESDKLREGQTVIEDLDQLADLIAYNVSDCVNLKEYVFENGAYKGQFFLKKGLLKTYPELVYEKLPDKYAPDIRPQRVRRDRMTLDSSSAQLATKSLCPYGHLTDIPVVSFMYPSKRKAEELGIKQVNVLEETRDFFYRNFPQPELRAEFDRIYRYYKAIEGKNFNASENYAADYGPVLANPPEQIGRFSKADTCLFYYNADGTPSSCFVTFSIGGIHGAEYNKALYEDDVARFSRQKALHDQVVAQYPDPVELRKAKTVDVVMPDGAVVTMKAMQFLKSGSTMKHAEYKDIEKKRPVLYKLDEKGGSKLNERYVFTSADPTNHEDFTSYYPNLLRMMSAFWNEGLGYDRYAEIFDNKTRYGFLMKKKNADLSPEDAEKYRDLRELTELPLDPFHISDEERAIYDIQRNGTKLILNSASGAADANFESNIRMNNQIISMRCIGQMFSYRIGQAQALAGARVISTNTDGLFTVLDAAVNDAILAKESADIGVEIEPEPTYLISKDSNNRLEMDPATGVIQAASGGSLACRRGPDPQKSLAHPALIDWALSEYLAVASHGYKGLSIDGPFDDSVGMNILKSATKAFPEPHMLLRMFQNVIASSVGSVTYNFAMKPGVPGVPIILQHYNRVFIMKDGFPGAVHLSSAIARVITPAIKAKRARENERPQQHDQLALRVLNANGVTYRDIPSAKEASVKKVTNIETDWHMLVCNEDLSLMDPAKRAEIIDNLDYDKYLSLLRDAFEDNWRNHLPSPEPDDDDLDEVQVPARGTRVGTAVALSSLGTVIQAAALRENVSQAKAVEMLANPEMHADVPSDNPDGPVDVTDGPKGSQGTGTPDGLPTAPETPPTAAPRADGLPWPPEDCPFDPDPPAGDAERVEALNRALEDCLAIAEGIAESSRGHLEKAEALVARIRGLLGPTV